MRLTERQLQLIDEDANPGHPDDFTIDDQRVLGLVAYCRRLRELLREAEALLALPIGLSSDENRRVDILRARIREALGEGADRG